MSYESATEAARILLAIPHDRADGPEDHLQCDLRLHLMRDHQITCLAADKIIDTIRAEQAQKLAATYKRAAKPHKKGVKR